MNDNNELHRSLSRCTGFTLIEVVMASVCMTVVLAGLASCLVLAGHAFDENRVLLTQQACATDPLDQMMTELRYATKITEHTPTAVTFQVPDQDGDTCPETIHYSWSGTAGDPILMTTNGGTPSVLVPSVQNLALTYDQRAVIGTGYARGEVISKEILLYSHVDAPGGHFTVFGATPTQWHALYLEPNVPSGSSSWDFTRFKVKLKKSSNADGYFAIQVRLPDHSGSEVVPSKDVLEERVVYEGTLSNQFIWYEYDFENVTGLDPNQDLFIVIKHTGLGGTQVALGQMETGIDDLPGFAMYKTSDAGATWVKLSGEMVFYAYGVTH